MSLKEIRVDKQIYGRNKTVDYNKTIYNKGKWSYSCFMILILSKYMSLVSSKQSKSRDGCKDPR